MVFYVSRGNYPVTAQEILDALANGSGQMGAILDMGGFGIIDIGYLQGNLSTNEIDDNSGGWDYKVGSGEIHDFIYNGTSKLEIGTDITFKDHILFDSNDAYDIGTLSIASRFIYNESGVAIIEGYATGFRPSAQTDTGILFCVPTAGGKTELRCGFQTGASQVIVTEP